ncbi:Cation efflux family [Teratosphaeria destructans]|uniref:Cation efflux family n=1 Tax=Teratosphaeria destructans TaxID=418781 RepID=A0A9W7SY11_9PEZI|nr:Cation efflux family [Teratosphaeria destructans]
MGLSKSNRILILLVVNFIFFLIEIVTGYAVHSLALVADAFHMLNDVLSLLVGLWAVKVANSRTNSKTYTYGWQRAETLGALVNGVFLVALCVTIFLDAIQRFFEPQHVKNPKVVLIVGCLGLTFNVLGLFLFHEHNHGPGGHDHGHGDESHAAEEGHAGHDHDHDAHVADESGNVVDVLPQQRVGGWPTTQQKSPEAESETTAVEADETTVVPKKGHKHNRSKSRRYSGIDDIYVSPNAFRRSIIEAGNPETIPSDDDENGPNAIDDHDETHDHNAPLLGGKQSGYGTVDKRKSIDHSKHVHAKPKEKGKGHGHSHGDLNMRGIFLHVMGDALGNIGVIATALVIWFAKGEWRFYFDPAISLVITVIILCSAIPLCRAASRILLQAVPIGVDVEDIKEDIQSLPGVVSCHHLHVWQLNDSKMVASLHVQVAFDFKEDTSSRYMHLAQGIRKCLHAYGIHSSTIQPEFCLDPDHNHQEPADSLSHHAGSSSPSGSARGPSNAGSVRGDADACLLECGDNCAPGKGCCPPAPKDGGQGHGHGDHVH